MGLSKTLLLGSYHSTPLSPYSSPAPWVHSLVFSLPGVLRTTSGTKLERGSVSRHQPSETSLAACLQMSAGPHGLPGRARRWLASDGWGCVAINHRRGKKQVATIRARGLSRLGLAELGPQLSSSGLRTWPAVTWLGDLGPCAFTALGLPHTQRSYYLSIPSANIYCPYYVPSRILSEG